MESLVASSISVWQHVNCLNKSVPEMHSHVAGTLSKQPTNSFCSRLVGLVVKASASRAADLGSNPAFDLDLFPDRVIPVIKIGTPVATLPAAWCHRVNAGTSRPGVRKL